MSASLSLNKACLICLLNSKDLVCQFCRNDLDIFDLQHYQNNLLNNPSVKLGIKKVKFNHLIALCDYQWPISTMLAKLKFSGSMIYAKALADLFTCCAINPATALPDLILPVPLSNQRFSTRLYNQSGLMADYIGRCIGVRVAHDVLLRQQHTAAQTSLSAAQRHNNLKNAFHLNKEIEHQHIVIFDDVLTTGATVNGICQLIERHYPGLTIDVWTICITRLHR